MDVNRKELSIIKEALGKNPRGMTITEISKAVGLNRHSVAKYMEVLVAAGHVDMRSFGPSKVYFLSQRVPISAMLSFSSDLIITLDKDMRARNVNDKLLEITGLSREEVLNKNIENFAYPRQTDPPLVPYIQTALNGKESSVDLSYQHGADVYYFILKSLPTIFENGETGVTIIMSDITRRKTAEQALLKERAELEIRVKERTAELEKTNDKLKAEIGQRIRSEQALRKAEEKYRNLVEDISEWIWETDLAGHFTYSSPNVYDLLGYRPEEIIALSTFDLMAPENAKQMYDKVMALAPKGTYPPMLEAELLHKDGRIVFFEASGKPIHDHLGTVIGFRGVARDVTQKKRMEEALRESESKLRSTIESVNDIVWEMDRQAKFTYVSPKVQDILGYDPGHYLGRVILEFMPPEDVAKFSEGFGRIFANPRPYSLEYLRMNHRDGSILSVEVNGSPFYDEKGQFSGFRGVTRDITRRKNADVKPELS